MITQTQINSPRERCSWKISPWGQPNEQPDKVIIIPQSSLYSKVKKEGTYSRIRTLRGIPEKVRLVGLPAFKYYGTRRRRISLDERRLQTAHFFRPMNQVTFLPEIRDAMFITYQLHTQKKFSSLTTRKTFQRGAEEPTSIYRKIRHLSKGSDT